MVANSHILHAYQADTVSPGAGKLLWNFYASAPILGVYQIVQGLRLIKLKLNSNMKQNPDNLRLYAFQGTVFGTYSWEGAGDEVSVRRENAARYEEEYEAAIVPLLQSKAVALIQDKEFAPERYPAPWDQHKVAMPEVVGTNYIASVAFLICGALLCFVSILHVPWINPSPVQDHATDTAGLKKEEPKPEPSPPTKLEEEIKSPSNTEKSPSASPQSKAEDESPFNGVVKRRTTNPLTELEVGQLTMFTNKILGYGSLGTIVYKGKFSNRAVAVKRLLRPFNEVATKEISALISSDNHPNVIRYFVKEEDTYYTRDLLTP